MSAPTPLAHPRLLLKPVGSWTRYAVLREELEGLDVGFDGSSHRVTAPIKEPS